MPSKKRKYNARFPAGRIKKIMQTDEEVGKVAQAVPIIISRTLELFVESLLKKSMQVTLSRNAKTLSPSHVKQCILAESRFDFLRDLVKSIPDVSAAEEREMMSAENSPNSSSRIADPTPPRRLNREDSNSSNSTDLRLRDDKPKVETITSQTLHPPTPPPPTPTAIDLTKKDHRPHFYNETLDFEQGVIKLNPSYSSQASTSYDIVPKVDVSNNNKTPVVNIDFTNHVPQIRVLEPNPRERVDLDVGGELQIDEDYDAVDS